MSVNLDKHNSPEVIFRGYTTSSNMEAGVITPENTTDSLMIEPQKEGTFSIGWATTCSLSSLGKILKVDYGFDFDLDLDTLDWFDSTPDATFFNFGIHTDLESPPYFTFATANPLAVSPDKNEVAVGRASRQELEVITDLFDQTATRGLRWSRKAIFDKVEELTLKS